MFVGHYAAGFLLKNNVKEIPLWLFFIAVQFVDILAFILVLLGVERMSYNPTDNPFLRTFIEYVPFTHSLSGNFIIALFVFLVFWKFKSKTWGIALSVAVLSHWLIDFIAHTEDMPLLFKSFKAFCRLSKSALASTNKIKAGISQTRAVFSSKIIVAKES